ncbi:hypothetical protein RA307_09930 [Xanthobacteraceae bacterium Astr-EGSB]|uniref:hypothetical protein n=1 Tax=Astrobacterium formosum TaxID=3069710 RepID=UPI0027B5B698|nr:hypothetical protein [Xanthobacteraceae bacterium Astr-EGSB]
MTTEVKTLGDALPREMARVRDELIPLYTSIGPVGAFALTMMRQDLDRAARAMVSGDLVEMIAVYESLKGYKA